MHPFFLRNSLSFGNCYCSHMQCLSDKLNCNAICAFQAFQAFIVNVHYNHTDNVNGVTFVKLGQKPIRVETCNGPLCAGKQVLNIQFAKYHIWNNTSEGFPNMLLSTETFNQSVRTEYSEAVNARYTFQPLWVSGWA